MSERGLEVSVSRQDVADLVGALAELSIAANETKVIEQAPDRAARLKRAYDLVGKWDAVFRIREQADRAAAEVKRRCPA